MASPSFSLSREQIRALPLTLRILRQNALEQPDLIDAADVESAFADWLVRGSSDREIPFRPGRLLMHDTTCTPALVDMAALRDAVAERRGDPLALSPRIPIDVSVDHSLSVDRFAIRTALAENMRLEMKRNAERYRFLKWASAAFEGLRVHPPGTGIMHTINLEQLSRVILRDPATGRYHPDTMLGTDSHTPMVNGIGVLGWGIGGLEAEAALFGLPIVLRIPDVVGVRFTGALAPGVTATDLALLVTERLRRAEVAGAFVEFFGPGIGSLSAGDRAVVANMAPEYGATTGYFPIDDRTLDYLRQTGRPAEQIALIRAGAPALDLWHDPGESPRYSREIEIDLGSVVVSLAGPRRPQDRIATGAARAAIEEALGRPLSDARGGVPDGAVAIAAITSCTNTTDPRLLITAGLLARKARQLGLAPAPWVKTSLAPGSPAARRYLERAGLLDDLAALGFEIVGYGCTTCIGNSGPLPPEIVRAQEAGRAVVAVLSGNRNFPGRVHPALDLGFLASPPLVVAFAIAGRIFGDILRDPLASLPDGTPIDLSDLWPSPEAIELALSRAIRPDDVPDAFAAASASPEWRALPAPNGPRFAWDPASRYLRPPPFVRDQKTRLGTFEADPILSLGDDITTDHISPAGRIDPQSPAGRWLIERGADPADLNVFAAYRGNWEVMVRGLFSNASVVNELGPDIPPGATLSPVSGRILPLWEAGQELRAAGRAAVILAGHRYGMGSSRDWAAKGVALLGVRAVIASSFERIHRQNLVGMGVLPIVVGEGWPSVRSRIRSGDCIAITAEPDAMAPRAAIPVEVRFARGGTVRLYGQAAVETRSECNLLAAGGFFAAMLRAA